MKRANFRRVNFKVLGLLVAVTLVAGVGIHFLHAHQVRRTAVSMLAMAEKAEKDNDPAKAAQYLDRYLTVRPKDNEALANLGLLRGKTAKRPEEMARAIRTLDQVLRNEPERKDVRTKLKD